MELSIDSIITILSLLVGGGGGAFFTWRWQRKKAKAEASSAEADAAKELQEVYQGLINDIKQDREEQKTYIAELKDDRRHLREERDDLRNRQDELEENIRSLRTEVARMGRVVASLRPFVCVRPNCPDRILAQISADGTVEPVTKGRKGKKDESKQQTD